MFFLKSAEYSSEEISNDSDKDFLPQTSNSDVFPSSTDQSEF